MKIDMDAALDPENLTVSLAIRNIPLDALETVLSNMAQPFWRQNIVDGIQGALAAKGLGIASTQRTFSTKPMQP